MGLYRDIYMAWHKGPHSFKVQLYSEHSTLKFYSLIICMYCIIINLAVLCNTNHRLNMCCCHNCVTAVHLSAYSPTEEVLCPVTKTDGTLGLESQTTGSSIKDDSISFYTYYVLEITFALTSLYIIHCDKRWHPYTHQH